MDGDGKISSSSSSDHSNHKKSDEDTNSTSSVEPAPFRYVFKHEVRDFYTMNMKFCCCVMLLWYDNYYINFYIYAIWI